MAAVFLFGAGTLILGILGWISYQFFKWFGTKWIENKFAQSLEAYKADQARELERLRHKISSVLDRAQRLHDREFEVLPDIWGKLVEAHRAATDYTSPSREYPRVESMPAERLERYINDADFTETQKWDVLRARPEDRQEHFEKVMEWRFYSQTSSKLMDFYVSYLRGAIFIRADLKDDMKKMYTMVMEAVVEHGNNYRARLEGGQTSVKARDYLSNNGRQLIEKIETMVSARLWDSTTAEL